MLTFLFATGIIYLIHVCQQELELYCYSLFFVLAFFAGLLPHVIEGNTKTQVLDNKKIKEYYAINCQPDITSK